ncbi:heterokaryon incompatibility protein-domain-containing protein [Aspergillus alliaceus]|uniref:Heterokaryon incompatibility protein-domain-containing protein n=1 Tax=Petromyces alliaceus TaxID=209559 RepID=A0A5N7CLG2_PETAA|nr:heterokaryon incompatibility protein-domain-containing protein [Aspergillus alliaceus]
MDEPCPLLQGRSQTTPVSIAGAGRPVSGLSPQDAQQIIALQQQPSSLCARCSNSRILNSFMNFQPWDEIQRDGQLSSVTQYYKDFAEARLYLGRPSSLLLTPSCPFCRMLYCILPRYVELARFDGGGAKSARVRRTGEPDIYFEPYRTYLRTVGWEMIPEELRNQCAIILGFTTSVRGTTLLPDYDPLISGASKIKDRYMTGPAIALESRFAAPDRRLFGLRPLENTLDWSRVRQALNYCLQRHRSYCHVEKPSELLTTRMIDVVERTVVPCPRDCDYVALSYVWGGVEPACQALENRCLPQTIEDAIEVAQALGRRYLWVDALCIDQSPTLTPSQMKAKIKQLDMMSTIYSCATVTIVALTGKHANAGLPGVSVPRLAQVKENIDGVTLFTIPQHYTLERGGALWSRRAWTMQEELLSRRSLVFTPSQVVFNCLVCEVEEGLDVTTFPDKPLGIHPHGLQLQKLYAAVPVSKAPQPSHDGGSVRRLSIFCNLLGTYTSRCMTNESDSLNAFRGMLTFLQRQLFPEGFVHGLPLRSHPSSLAWMHRRGVSPRRRAEFPSWSWTGWEGEVAYPEKLLDTADGHSPYTSDIELELHFLSSHEDEIEIEGWLVDLDVRTEPFSEIFIPGQDDSIGTVKEGLSIHNNTLKTGQYTCLVIQRLYEKMRGPHEWRKETVFMLALERINQQTRRHTVLTVTMFSGQGFDQIRREKQVIRLSN